MPADIQRSMAMQEHNLLNHKKDNYLNELMARNIANKLKKKEEDLLIYKSDSYRLKRELDNVIENKQNLFERYGINNW